LRPWLVGDFKIGSNSFYGACQPIAIAIGGASLVLHCRNEQPRGRIATSNELQYWPVLLQATLTPGNNLRYLREHAVYSRRESVLNVSGLDSTKRL
jgi:hypothetical protein